MFYLLSKQCCAICKRVVSSLLTHPSPLNSHYQCHLILGRCWLSHTGSLSASQYQCFSLRMLLPMLHCTNRMDPCKLASPCFHQACSRKPCCATAQRHAIMTVRRRCHNHVCTAIAWPHAVLLSGRCFRHHICNCMATCMHHAVWQCCQIHISACTVCIHSDTLVAETAFASDLTVQSIIITITIIISNNNDKNSDNIL